MMDNKGQASSFGEKVKAVFLGALGLGLLMLYYWFRLNNPGFFEPYER